MHIVYFDHVCVLYFLFYLLSFPFSIGMSFYFLFFGFLRQGFSVALGPTLELAVIDQAGLELTEIHLPLLPECWD